MMTRCIRALLFGSVILAACASFAQVRVSIRFGPPALPVYEQPVCPGDGYMWVPGYWAYDYDFNDYYWVPGTWVQAPEPGFFWTPGYWAWENDAFLFHDGYWGPHVGFYGGINYGYGYFGDGYQGGRWDNGHFFYNRAVNNVNVTVIHNVYNTTVINNTVNRVSYNGGNGGINARPRAEDEVAMRDRHIAAVAAQNQQRQEARSDPQQRASTNRGRPDIAATPKPSAFKDRSVVRASAAGGDYNPPNRNNDNRGPNDNRVQNNNVPRPGNNNIIHAKDIPKPERPTPPNTGDAKRDQKYQQQQEKLYAKQDQQRQKLEQKQDQEHQKMQQQKANEQRQQQVEQHHQQQTQKLQQRQEQQMQKMQTRQAPRPQGPEHR